MAEPLSPSLEIPELTRAYAAGKLDPRDVLRVVYARADAEQRPVFITRVPLEIALRMLDDAERRRDAGELLPLFGVPFAIKDNIDLAGAPTTCACPSFAYVPAEQASVVARLLRAGAIPVGKTNLDQFATGLVGVRSPYGACSSAFDDRYISGGSSSGSATGVALGLASFALGTDTAGSGRVPAAFNNVVGYKPTRGVINTAGVVPACRSLDCVSVFAASASDAALVLAAAAGDEPRDPYSRPAPPDVAFGTRFRFGVPRAEQLLFFGDDAAKELFERAFAELRALGGEPVEFDFAPFRATADLLYGGPWLVERLSGLEEFLRTEPRDLDPTVGAILKSVTGVRGVDVFRGLHRLQQLERETGAAWARFDVMLLPTTGTIYTIEQVRAAPIELNNNLGYYTNFVNLLDLCGVAVPAGFRANGLPFGVTLLAPRDRDFAVLRLADALHRRGEPTIGATGVALGGHGALAAIAPAAAQRIELAVVGAHLRGQPLNRELVERDAEFLRQSTTAAEYRFYALDTTPPKPGLVREPGFEGPGIEVELWSLSAPAFADFVARIPPPLGIGAVQLADGSSVRGFICESYAVRGAREITEFGGWRAYLGAPAPAKH
jgi:allophanate hydrolase